MDVVAPAVAPSPLVLRRRELLTTAATSRGCLLVYPATRKGRQRFGVGDVSGCFAVYGVASSKSRDCALVFRTPASPSAANDSSNSANADASATAKAVPVSCATLYRDQLFVMRGSALDAYTRKGTHFFHVDTSVTDSAHALVIDTPFIFVAGDYILTALRETRELGFYLCPDRIHAMVAFTHRPRVYGGGSTHDDKNGDGDGDDDVTRAGADKAGGVDADVAATAAQAQHTLDSYYCVCACHDGVLRVVRSCKLLYEVACEAVATALCYDATLQRVYVGTQAGSVAAYAIVTAAHDNDDDDDDGRRVVLRLCARQGGATGESTAAVTCVRVCDVDGDGEREVLAGCHNGSVAIYRHVHGGNDVIDGNDAPLQRLVCVWRVSVDERVMSIDGGVVVSSTSARTADVLVHTYSGRVLAFSVDKAATTAAAAAAADTSAMTTVAALAVDADVTVPCGSGDHVVDGSNDDATQQQQQLQQLQQQHVQLAHEVAQLRERVAAAVREVAMCTSSNAPGKRRRRTAAVTSTFRATATLTPLDNNNDNNNNIDSHSDDAGSSSSSSYRSSGAELALYIDADVPLECVVLRSALPLTFVGTRDTRVVMQDSTHATQPRTRALALATPVVHEQRDVKQQQQRRNNDEEAAAAAMTTMTSSEAQADAQSTRSHNDNNNNNSDNDDVMPSSRRYEVHVCVSDVNDDHTTHDARNAALTLTLYAATSPRTAHVRTLPLCALPLHTRLAATAATSLLTPTEAQLVLSHLRLTSDAMTWADVHGWLSLLLPGVATMPAHALRTQPRLYYRCAHTGTVLVVEVQTTNSSNSSSSGSNDSAVSSLTFYSDALTTLHTIRRCIANAVAASAQHRRLSLQTDVSARYGAVARELQLLQPRLEQCTRARAHALLARALRELDMDANDAATHMPEELRAYAAPTMTTRRGATHGDDDDDEALRARQLAQLQRTLCRVYDSLVAFKGGAAAGEYGGSSSHVATAHDALRRVTSARECDMAALLRVYFPHDEHMREREQLMAVAAAAAARVHDGDNNDNATTMTTAAATLLLRDDGDNV